VHCLFSFAWGHMAGGRLFSSRRMFSSRRTVFIDPRRSRPWLRAVTILVVTLLVFAAGVYTGSAFPHLVGDRVSAPVTATEF